jgi:hypothetical protein
MESSPWLFCIAGLAKPLILHAKTEIARQASRMPNLLGFAHPCEIALWPWRMQTMSALHGKTLPNGVSDVQDPIIRRHGLARFGGHENSDFFSNRRYPTLFASRFG